MENFPEEIDFRTQMIVFASNNITRIFSPKMYKTSTFALAPKRPLKSNKNVH